MMTGYHRQPDKTREAEWFDATGKRFIRTGDVGLFDAQGFLTLLDRRKDMVLSGGFNNYPSDREAELRKHPAVEGLAGTCVPDPGPGFPMPGPLFQPFARGVASDGPAGLGLGLALARSLAKAMGGELSYRHRDGGGAELVLSLPRA